jgi:CheY-like chemotaxis protein
MALRAILGGDSPASTGSIGLSAASGDEAVEKAREHEPDVILKDISHCRG